MSQKSSDTSMKSFNLRVSNSKRKSIKDIQKYCQDEQDYETLKTVFNTNESLIYDCLGRIRKGNIVQPKYNPCINYSSYCDSMIREINNNLETLK